MPALLLDHVSHAYDDLLAVADLDLPVQQGELVCLLGPSGCGKTTALRLAAGLERLQVGRVIMDGRIVADAARDVPPEQRNVGLVFQDYALFPHLSVLENVVFGLRGLPATERKPRAIEALELVGMAGAAESFPHTLSGGQQQRVALARALAPKPKVMLLDEPFSGLDSQLRNQVRDQTLHVLQESGMTSLIVTHDPEEAMFMADKIALMRQGRLVQMGAPAELYFSPLDAFVATFFGDINRFDGVVRSDCVATPLGRVAAKGLLDGTRVEILIRPEALHLSLCRAAADPVAASARVMAARLLGRTSLVHLSIDGPNGQRHHLHSRMPGRFLPAPDEPVAIDLDPAQTFVFPVESPT